MATKQRTEAGRSAVAESPARNAARARSLFALAALALATGVAYHGSFHGPFVFDDVPAIVENPDIRSFTSALRENPRIDTATAVGRPLLRVSLWANYAIGGLDVRGYHAVNLALHLATAWALFALIRLLLQSPAMRARTGAAADALALAVALLWSVHPLQTESVTYVVQRTEILAAFFYLMTLLGVVRCANASGWRTSLWAAGAVLACLLGMAAKETLVSAPVVAIAMDRVFLATSWRELWRMRGRLYAALASTWLFLAFLIAASSGRKSTVGFDLGTSWWHYVATQPYYLCRYLFLSLWPGPLTLDYGRYHATTPGEVLPYALVVAALVATTLWALWRKPALGFCGLWFFAILAPTSSVIPIVTQTGAEHRMYLPLAGVIAAVIVGFYTLVRRSTRVGSDRRFAALGAAAIALIAFALGARTVARNADYRSETAIWQSVVAKWPRNPRAHLSLGATLSHQGLAAEAIPHFERALALEPDYSDARVELGTAFATLGQIDAAIAHFDAALRLHPELPDAHNNLGTTLLKAGRVDEAILHFEVAARHESASPDAFNNWGNALLRAGRPSEAIARYEQALRARPAFAEAHYNLGKALADAGRANDAIAHYEQALALRPDDAPTHVALAGALAKTDRLGGAIAHYEDALRIEPEQPELLNNLAWLYATDPDPGQRNPSEAIRLAERAVALGGGQNPSLLDTLAVAYAAAGRFRDAVAHAERALEVAQEQGQIELASEIERHLARHRAGLAAATP